jgi:DNA-binding transcriptional ArsR family regulator
MELDLLFRALSDPTRRRLMDELAERDGQTLFELHLATLEEAGLLRTEWRWRSKHHFLEREPIRRAWKLWLGGFARPERTKEETPYENRADERARG